MNTHAIELPPLPEPLEIDWPELHSQALGCGVEDRSIHDRYEAAEYGWQDGVDKAAERVPDQIYDAEQMQAYAIAAIEADRKRRGEHPVLRYMPEILAALKYPNVNVSLVEDIEAALDTPQPAEPVKRKRRYAQGTALGEFGIIPMCDQVDDEPVKVPSDGGEPWPDTSE